MQTIEQLQQEIDSFETEIKKLQQELNTNSQTIPRVQSDSPADIASAFRAAAVATYERASDIQGIRDAIAQLNSRLAQKKSQLEQLQKEQEKQERQRRVEEAKEKIRQEIEVIDDIAALTKTSFLKLKSLYQQYNAEFKALSDRTPGSFSYQLEQLIHFESTRLPVLTEKDGSFILSSRVLDLFEPERKAEQAERAARSRAYRENHEQQMSQFKQKQIAEEARQRREQLETMLSAKQTELEGIKARRAELKSWGGSMNLSGLDHAIAQLEHEIASLQESAE